MCTHAPFSAGLGGGGRGGGGGVEPPTKFSLRRGLTRPQLLDEAAENDDKSLYTNIFFPIITKDSNWEILTKNLLNYF